jgi:hypothetical protein
MSNLSSLLARAGVGILALTLVQASAAAAPFSSSMLAASNPQQSESIPVAMGEGRFGGPGYRYWPRARGGGHWNGGRHWGGGWNGRHWGHGGHWRRGGWGGGWGWGSGFALGLGLGLPLGYYGGGYYDGYYPRYYRPVVRYGGGSAHVRWCYARYRSYRAWDDTFQPYHGPRRPCYSPY